MGLAPPPRDQTNRDLPRTYGVGVALAYSAYATVYRSECPQGPEWPPPQRIIAGDGAGEMCCFLQNSPRTTQPDRQLRSDYRSLSGQLPVMADGGVVIAAQHDHFHTYTASLPSLLMVHFRSHD